MNTSNLTHSLTKTEIATGLAKAVASRYNTHSVDASQLMNATTSSTLYEMANTARERAFNSNEALRAQPDLRLAREILVSMMLSPRDLHTVILKYELKDKVKLPSVLREACYEAVSTYLQDDVKLHESMSAIIREVLTGSGAYPILTLPESSLDAFLHPNVSGVTPGVHMAEAEHASSNLSEWVGILGPGLYESSSKDEKVQRLSESEVSGYLSRMGESSRARKLSWNYVVLPPDESKNLSGVKTNISVVDNPELVKKALISRNLLQHKQAEAMQKAYPDRTYAELRRMLYSPAGDHKPFDRLADPYTLGREWKGMPLTTHVPTPAIAVIHPPGSPESHAGYLVLTSRNGVWLSSTPNMSYFEGLSQRFQGSSTGGAASTTAYLSTRANVAVTGNLKEDHKHIETMTNLWQQALEQDYLARLARGLVGEDITLQATNEWYLMQLQRDLQNKETRVLYIPASLLTYFAIQYDENGMGLSLLAEGSEVLSLRSAHIATGMLAAARNSIARTKVTINIDPRHPDPERVSQEAINTLIRNKSGEFPFGQLNIIENMRLMTLSGYEFNFVHPKLSTTTAEFAETNSNYPKPDEELGKDLQAQCLALLYLTPEMVDAAKGPEFATSLTENSLMLTKRIAELNRQCSKPATHFVANQCRFSGALCSKVDSILKAEIDVLKSLAKDEKLAYDDEAALVRYYRDIILSNVTCSLPEPFTASAKAKLTSYEDLVKVVDAYLESYFGNDQDMDKAFPEEVFGDFVKNIGMYRAHLRLALCRAIAATIGLSEDLPNILEKDDNGLLTLSLQKEQSRTTAELFETCGQFGVVAKELKKQLVERFPTSSDTEADASTPDTTNTSADTGGTAEDDAADGGAGGDSDTELNF